MTDSATAYAPRKTEITIQGRRFPRVEIDMELELQLIKQRKTKKVLIGRGRNTHEVATFVEFLERNGIEVVQS